VRGALTRKSLNTFAKLIFQKWKQLGNRIKIDEINAQILKILLKDARTSFTEIAKTCKISISAAKMRYKHLWKVGIITGEIMQVNPYSLGYKCVGNIGINTSPESEKEVRELLEKKSPFFTPVSGSWVKYSIGVLVVKKNIEEWAAELRRLDSIPYIKQVDPLIWIKPTGMDHSENLEIKPLENKKLENTIEQIPTIINNEPVKIDETDRQIAKILIHSSRTSFRKIAKQLNISTKQVIQRYQKLAKTVLTLSTITLDLKKLGYEAAVGIFVKGDRFKMSEISNKILQMPNVIVFFRVIGSYDLVAIAVLRDFSSFIRLQKEIHGINGIEQVDFAITKVFDNWPLNVFASLLE
jgi:DNA-binding Lrp family transcriptional regulator